jgi:hypothetical protein
MNLPRLYLKYKTAEYNGEDAAIEHGKKLASETVANWLDFLIAKDTNLYIVKKALEDNIALGHKALRSKKRPLVGFTRLSELAQMSIWTQALIDLEMLD